MAAKIFEVGDVLPATTQLAIYSSIEFGDSDWSTTDVIATTSNYLYIEWIDESPGTAYVKVDGVTIVGGYAYRFPLSDNPIIINTSNWTESQRTVTTVTLPGDNKLNNLVWEDLAPTPSGYSITFEENGGSTVTDLTEQTNLPSPLPTTTKANHVFAGWYYDNLFTQKANAGDELTTNVTLYAKWYTPTTWCEDIADAIREKDGTTEPIKHLDFPERILAIESAVKISQDDYDNLEEVNENVYYIIMEEE